MNSKVKKTVELLRSHADLLLKLEALEKEYAKIGEQCDSDEDKLHAVLFEIDERVARGEAQRVKLKELLNL